MKFFRIVSTVLMLSGSASLHAESSFTPAAGTPIPFQPFKISDFCKSVFNGSCIEKYQNPDEEFLEKETFAGTIGAYVEYLNTMEQIYNASGETLRPKNADAEPEVTHPMEIPTDPSKLKEQLLYLLSLNTGEVLHSILGLDPKAECPLLPEPGRDVEDPHFRYPSYAVPGLNSMPFDDIIRRFNEHQEILCPLGMALYDKLDPNKNYRPEDLIQALMAIRAEILEQLGLSAYSGAFSMESLQKIQAGIDIAKDIKDLIDAQQVPSPEQLFALREKLNAQLPDGWDIPDVPNIPSPQPPIRSDLAVKKRKEWSGFNFGERDRFATYANAYIELRGSEDEQQATAYGAAGIYILAREINAIGGYASGFAGPSGMSLDVEMKAFGQHIFDPIKQSKSVQIVKNDPKAFDWELDESVTQTFMAGPIPVSVKAGARVGIGLGYNYGIYTTQLKGGLTPYAVAEAYAQGEAGIPGLLSVGAEAQLTLLNLQLPLTGYGAIKFDAVGYPFLKLGVESRIQYLALNGRLYAFANYLVPRWGLPPVKKKRAEYDVFNWNGSQGTKNIMNWGLEVGRNGTKLTGDLLDQTDRAEATALDEAINLENRQEAMHNFGEDVRNKTAVIFESLHADLDAKPNTDALKFQGFMPEAVQSSKVAVDVYQGKFDQIFIKKMESL